MEVHRRDAINGDNPAKHVGRLNRKWKSSNMKVATVINGVVTFKKKGSVTITCTAMRGKKKAKIKFNVGS